MLRKRKKSEKLGIFQNQILFLLKYRSMHGYELLEFLKKKGWQPSTGSLYPALKKLEEKGYIESFESSQLRGPKKRKNYMLTVKGLDYLQENFFYDITQDILRTKLYINPFQELVRNLTPYFNKGGLVIDLLNYLDPEAILNYLLKGRIPKTIEFMKIYEFYNLINENKMKIWTQILLFFPFSMTYRDFGGSPIEKYQELFNYIKKFLTDDGKLWIIDVEWIQTHFLVDALTFLATGDIKQMAYTFDEIKSLLLSIEFKNITKISSKNGILVISADK
ncbi:MAG: PadR family transcriptional regulator [Candidatus Hodarchaeota archaeon]